MRNTFINTLVKIAKTDKRIMLLSADIGYSVLEEFMNRLPQQYLNAGISEQNITGMAAGMAMEGRIPIIYSIIPFVTMRNFEQIRNDICYQNLNVKIVGVGAGFSYGPYGHTHHALEDIGILRPLPNLSILAPGDPIEAEWAARMAIQHKGPVYVRLGKKGEPNIHKNQLKIKIGQGVILADGHDLTLVATSNLLQTADEVKNNLKEKGLSIRLVSMPTIKPIDKLLILESAKKTKALFTLEEHFITGGLGSAVAEILAENAIGIKFKRIGVADRFTKKIGLQEYMRKANNLSVDQISKQILLLLEKFS